MKMKTIKLQGPTERLGPSYEAGKTITSYWVLQVTNSIEFAPHTWIDKPDVLALCEHSQWKVTIVGRDG